MYDPQKAPRSFERLREIKYGVTWKPITPFRLEPGFERVQRIKVSNENMQDFTAAIDSLELLNKRHQKLFQIRSQYRYWKSQDLPLYPRQGWIEFVYLQS